jgi:hypothetical protein
MALALATAAAVATAKRPPSVANLVGWFCWMDQLSPHIRPLVRARFLDAVLLPDLLEQAEAAIRGAAPQPLIPAEVPVADAGSLELLRSLWQARNRFQLVRDTFEEVVRQTWKTAARQQAELQWAISPTGTLAEGMRQAVQENLRAVRATLHGPIRLAAFGGAMLQSPACWKWHKHSPLSCSIPSRCRRKRCG